jgi:hypothetical protein
LKVRIQSEHGHLGNHQTSDFLADNFTDNLSHICLAHLSKNNNTPEKALQTLREALSDRGIMLKEHQQIMVLNRSQPTEIVRLID